MGTNDGRIAGSYATGRVSGSGRVGGLVGHNRREVTAVYATGPVSGAAETGGLVGATEPPGRVTAGYWDTDASGVAAAPAGGAADTSDEGRPAAALQAPADYADLYAGWDVDGRRRRGGGRPVALRDGVGVSGAVAGRGRRRAVDVGGAGASTADRPGGDGDAGGPTPASCYPRSAIDSTSRTKSACREMESFW